MRVDAQGQSTVERSNNLTLDSRDGCQWILAWDLRFYYAHQIAVNMGKTSSRNPSLTPHQSDHRTQWEWEEQDTELQRQDTVGCKSSDQIYALASGSPIYCVQTDNMSYLRKLRNYSSICGKQCRSQQHHILCLSWKICIIIVPYCENVKF